MFFFVFVVEVITDLAPIVKTPAALFNEPTSTTTGVETSVSYTHMCIIHTYRKHILFSMFTFQVDLTLSDSDDEVPLKTRQAAAAAATKAAAIAVPAQQQQQQQQQTASVTVAPVQAAPVAKTNGRFNFRNKAREKMINYNE